MDSKGEGKTERTSRTYALCDPNLILFEEAVALLELARDGKAVDRERAERFARAVVEATELGRMAMAVLDGGLFAGARVVELAEEILAWSPARKDPIRKA